jgi:aspartate carbamoyltransferase catalytic subunit
MIGKHRKPRVRPNEILMKPRPILKEVEIAKDVKMWNSALQNVNLVAKGGFLLLSS